MGIRLFARQAVMKYNRSKGQLSRSHSEIVHHAETVNAEAAAAEQEQASFWTEIQQLRRGLAEGGWVLQGLVHHFNYNFGSSLQSH